MTICVIITKPACLPCDHGALMIHCMLIASFLPVTSTCGFRCFQMHALKTSKLSITCNMRKELMAPHAYHDFIIKYGAPNKTVSDNARVYLSKHWTDINL